MRDEADHEVSATLGGAFGLLCRLAADVCGARWAAIVPPGGGRVVWSAGDDAPPERALVAACGAIDGAVEGVVTLPRVDGAFAAVVGLPGTDGRLIVLDPAPLRPDRAQRRALTETAALAAARIRAADAPVAALARFGHFRLDRASGSVSWSAEAYRLFGYDPAERPPSLAMALAAFPERAQTELRQGIAQSWETGDEVSVAASITRRDGVRRDVLARLRADPADGGGARTTLSGILLDVTEARAFDDRLERERELLRTTLDHMDQGLLVVGPDMSVPVLSRRVTELLCLPDAFTETHPSFPDILTYQYESGSISLETLNSSINAYILAREELPEVHVYDRETFDGRMLEVRTTKLPDGGFVRTFTDQTVRRRREVEVARAQAEYRRLFENSIIGIFRATPEGRLLRANPAFARLHGYPDEAAFLAAATGPMDAFDVDPARGGAFMRLLLRDGCVTDFVSEVRLHGTRARVWMSLSGWAIRDEAGAMTAFEGTAVEATERKRAEDRIAHMARHDALTGLPNRPSFIERLGVALAAGEGAEDGVLALLFFDIDRFKAVNDTFGHATGDALLRAFAGRIVGVAGAEAVVARFGGDEFAVIAPGADADAAAALVERMLAAIRAPLVVDGVDLSIGASVGVALAPLDGRDATALMKSADIALYRAKDEGRDAWRFFEPAMADDLAARQTLELDLRAALDRDEFGLIYQPVICTASGVIRGYEALLRWSHPQRGLVLPEAFIAIAEETRLIGSIGGWVLTRACADAAAWPDGAALWVNVSAVQLASSGFEATLEAALSASGLAPARVVLEVTETSLMGGDADLAPRLERLRARGLRIALDDFGTGYSSLGYLRRFAFDVIKIDRSFVADLAQSETAAIVMSVLDLARRLGIATVAEGVETEAQLTALRVAGCRLVQGHLFGPPVEAAAIGTGRERAD